MGNAVGVNGQFGVGRKASIDLGSKRRQLHFQLGDERLPISRHIKSVAVSRKTRLAGFPGQELGPVVTEFLCSGNIDISDLQSVRQMDKNANLKGTRLRTTGSVRRLTTKLCHRCEAKPRSTFSFRSS